MWPRLLLPILVPAWLAACAGVPADPASTPAAAGSVRVAAAKPAVASPPPTAAVPVAEQAFGAGTVVEQFGVRLTSVRLTANGYVVDLRYRVLDPGKAQPLLDRAVKPVLVDEATGNRFYIPVPPTVGALRQTSRNKVIHTDRDYFMMFANPDRKLRPGSTVALYVGDQRFGNLQVAAQTVAPAVAQSSERSSVQPAAR